MAPKELAPAFALVAGWLAAMAVVLVLVLDARQTALERGEREAAALAQVTEGHTARTFQAALLVVRGIAESWWLFRPSPHNPAFQATLSQRLADLEQAKGIFILDERGRLIHDTNYPQTPDTSFADRRYFRAYLQNPQLDRGVFGPLASRSPGAGWFVAVTARLGFTEAFQGLVGAAVDPVSFETLYARMATTEGDVIALFHRNGTLIARYPPAGDEIGRSFAALPLFTEQLPQAETGSFRGEGVLLPGKRIVSYRSVDRLPLVVYISRLERAVLSEWRRSATGAAIAMGALTLLLTWLLVREIRHEQTRKRKRAQQAQADKMEALGQLTGGIAHDFNNVLGVIGNSLHLIARAQNGKPQDRDAVAEALAMAQRSVARGRELCDRLLAFARRKPLEVGAADLNALASRARPLLEQAAGARIELAIELAPRLPAVLTDESQFDMALLNLVVNARDALGGRGRIVIRTSADKRGGACLAVEDNGPGMPEEVRRHAEEPFFTTKGESGTGLGLAQVYGFMQEIGGALEIDSAPGRGCRVQLRFPPAGEAARPRP